MTHSTFVTQACPGGPAKIAPLANHFFFDTMNEKNEFWNIREKVPDFFSSPQVVSSGCSVFPTHTRTHTGFKTQHPQKQNEGFCSAVWLIATTNPMFCYISYNLPTSCGSSDRSISKG